MVSLALWAAMMGTVYFLWARCAQHGGRARGGGLVCVSLRSYRALPREKWRTARPVVSFEGSWCLTRLGNAVRVCFCLSSQSGAILRPTLGPRRTSVAAVAGLGSASRPNAVAEETHCLRAEHHLPIRIEALGCCSEEYEPRSPGGRASALSRPKPALPCSEFTAHVRISHVFGLGWSSGPRC